MATNNEKPIERLDWTIFVWCPKYVPSNVTSLNHKIIENVVESIPMINKNDPYWIPLKYSTAETIILNVAPELKNGQGELLTMWWGWYCFL